MNFRFFLISCLIFGALVNAAPEPAKIVNGGIYKLEIQSEDKWLTSSENGEPVRSRWGNKAEQKWKFSGGENGWQLSPLNGKPMKPLWKISYVGHGKYRFLNEATGLCLAGQGGTGVGERNCEKDSPYQRWLVVATIP